jgi:hypothetical protein
MSRTQTGENDTASKPAKKSFREDVRDAVTKRTMLLMIGVLVLGLGFITSYVGAFHSPTPHRVPIAVVAPAQASARVVDELNALPGQPLHAQPAASATDARALVGHGSTSAALLVSGTGTTDSLLVATGGGAAVATAVETVIGNAEAAQHRSLTVADAIPAQTGDARGLSGFYLVVGWLVAGYIVAALLGIASGQRATSGRRALIRLSLMASYSILAGIGGALIVGPLLGALTGHVIALAALGALLVFCAASVTMAFQALAGIVGIGLTLLLFVILGNPSAGGAYSASMLPGFWRVIGGVIPNGAAVQAVRNIVYFGAHDVTGNLLVIAAWAFGGAIVAFGVAKLRAEGARERVPQAEGRAATGLASEVGD